MNNHVTSARHISFLAVASLAVLSLFITSCSSNDSSTPTPTYTVGGTVTGTSGTGLVMQLNGASNLAISADGAFTFSTALTSGSSYAVTALSSPASQTCRVTNGSGSIGSASINNVSVECRTNADPNGYYTNTGNASVGDGNSALLAISDFQAIIQDNRFMAMSVAQQLVYDGPLEMFGAEFTATVSVYHEGVMIYSGVSVSGTVEAGVSVDGDFAGTQQGAGSFGLVYATTNTGPAAVARIESSVANPTWASTLGNSTTATEFDINSAAVIYGGHGGPSDGNFQDCTIYSHLVVAVSPIAGSRLYRITVQLGDCLDTSISSVANGGTAGLYTGFATSRTDSATPDDTLVFIVTSANGQYTASGDFK